MNIAPIVITIFMLMLLASSVYWQHRYRKLVKLVKAADELRTAQRAYMAVRNDPKVSEAWKKKRGANVGYAASVYDGLRQEVTL